MICNLTRSSDCAHRHVLLVEDNPDGRESLQVLLQMLGHRVDVASDGVEGVGKAVAVHPDVALIDIGLPRLDGCQVARRIRAMLGRSVTLLAYTAYDSPDIQDRIARAGFDAHLVKPIEMSELAPWLDVGPFASYDASSTASVPG